MEEFLNSLKERAWRLEFRGSKNAVRSRPGQGSANRPIDRRAQRLSNKYSEFGNSQSIMSSLLPLNQRISNLTFLSHYVQFVTSERHQFVTSE